MSRLIIKGGRIIDPGQGIDGVGDVVIADRLIVAVEPGLSIEAEDDDQVLDASGCLVAPGLIDPHVHLREPGGDEAETIATGAAAAIDGGFTTVCCMPNTTPCLDTPEMVRFVGQQAAKANRCRVFVVGAVSVGRRGEQLADLDGMHRAGAVAFSDDGDVVESPALMQHAFRVIRDLDSVMMQHCQERTLTEGASMNAGPTAEGLGLIGWPSVAEELIIERDIRINRSIGCRYHVQHMSSGESVAIVRDAQIHGQPVTAEASPHHLLLTDEACAGYDTMAKMNPPLRSHADVEALRAGVADGTVTILATDHAPHTAERKSLDFNAAPFGIIGLEVALALYVKALIDPKIIGWSRLIELMTINPAKLCGLTDLGSLKVGSPADVSVIDPELDWTIRRSELAGKSTNTPFDGWDVEGRAVAVVVGGDIKLDRQGRRNG